MTDLSPSNSNAKASGDSNEMPVPSESMAIGEIATPSAAPAQPPVVSGSMNIGMPTTFGLSLIAMFFGVFGVWLAFAPLDSAALAPGIVRVESNRKTIQHFEGGIIKEILIREGDLVHAGDPIVLLDNTQALATLKLLEGRLDTMLAFEARLIAERDDKAEISFPERLLERREDSAVAEILTSQQNIFNARAVSLDGQSAILNQRISQAEEQISGLDGQIASEKRQLSLISEEIADVQVLLEEGLARKPRLLALQRDAEEIEGSLGRNRSQIAQVKQQILESELRISELKTEYIKESVQQLREVQGQTSDLDERIRAARDVLKRIAIVAPITGTVVGLQIHTEGGVIAPGAALMDIVPSQDSWVIEAKVDLNDIDIVRVGLPAQIRFSAYNQRNLPPVDGIVTSVSADRFTDEGSGHSYFLAQVEISDTDSNISDEQPLISGMQADVMIVTGERTALNYLLAPLLRSFDRSFKEN